MTTQEAHATLLTYWNFNNTSPAYNTNLGSFSTSSAVYGEAYTQADTSHAGTLASNTSNNTVFNGSGIKIDFSNIDTIATPTINGKKWSDHSSQEGTGGSAGFGTFSSSSTNLVGTDTAGNSLLFLNPGNGMNGKYITFSLSSLGYNSLTLTYDTRLSSAMTSGSEIWTYSTDGTNYNTLTTLNPTRDSNFNLQTLNLSSLSGSVLDNQSTFYLRLSFNSSSGNGSYGLDNIQLNGTAISAVPEPSTYALLGGVGALGLAFVSRRKRG